MVAGALTTLAVLMDRATREILKAADIAELIRRDRPAEGFPDFRIFPPQFTETALWLVKVIGGRRQFGVELRLAFLKGIIINRPDAAALFRNLHDPDLTLGLHPEHAATFERLFRHLNLANSGSWEWIRGWTGGWRGRVGCYGWGGSFGYYNIGRGSVVIIVRCLGSNNYHECRWRFLTCCKGQEQAGKNNQRRRTHSKLRIRWIQQIMSGAMSSGKP